MGAPRSVGHAGNAQRYQQLRERLARTSITESSRDGVVRVTVSAGGLVTDLVLRDDRHPGPLPEIAAQGHGLRAPGTGADSGRQASG